MERYTLSLLVANRFGVLTKVTTLFGRRGSNIHSLCVSAGQSQEQSRITVVLQEDEEKLRQIYNQLEKLEDVREVRILSGGDHVERSIALIRTRSPVPETRYAGDQGLTVKTRTLPDSTHLLEAFGPTGSIDALAEGLGDCGVLGLSRSGCTALPLDGTL